VIYFQKRAEIRDSKKGGKEKKMLTQIEIDGFKTFKDFKVELAPFQVIVGPNGSGKSNLFDALQLLSRLAEMVCSGCYS
jgi:AAA15 family ATPase/GTPase